jgi:calcium-dependent protein kinase
LSSIKLIDFGVASFFDESQRMKEPVGTFYYAAPEVMGKDYDSKCDMWSVGIISFLLLTGKPPFEQADDSVITEKVKALKFQDLEASLAAVSSEAADFIRQLIQPAESRASAEQALNHPWLAGSSPSTLRSVSADVIESLRKFHKGNKLQEAVRAYITSQCLTVQETKELKDLFKQIDSNGDGKISKEELQNYYLKVMGDNYDLTEVEKIMKEIDSDQSGFVDYSEFIKATVSNSVINNVKNLRLAFMKFDSDNSGKISADEFRAVLDSEFRYSENVWKQIVKIADKNNDGEIDFSEFMQVVLES